MNLPVIFDSLADFFGKYREDCYLLFRHYTGMQRSFLMRSDLWDGFQQYCAEEGNSWLATSPLAKIIHTSQEAAIDSPWIYMLVRPYVARRNYIRIHLESLEIAAVSPSEYLTFKELMVRGREHADDWVLEFDIGPFNRELPMLKESRSIGRGVEFLNRRLSSQLFDELGKGDQRLLDFLRVHQCQGMQLMVNDRINDVDGLRLALRRADEYLATVHGDEEWREVGHTLETMGFEPGWGRTVARMRDTLRLLSDILEAPDPANLEHFLSRIPMIFSIVIVSPHGYFGQANVLGLPDTGGQVVYILDQVHALEKEMITRIHEQGLEIDPQILVLTRLIPNAPPGTTCDQAVEPIVGTRHARIVRIPFRNPQEEVIPHWISRFEVWPYLEGFAVEAEKTVLAELGSRPDLVIGNYSDGSLVATLLAQGLQVTQCNIAHALEKAKYLMSDLYWQDNDQQYHFSCQFTADLVAMNAADFIITSTYHEIAGREDVLGQYESYCAFTLPDLYRIVQGIDLFDPKFNIVSPGADAEVYFPYTDHERRLMRLHKELDAMIFDDTDRPDARGHLSDRNKPLLFTMARLDRIKNITGLVEWYANSPRLQEEANLVVVAGHVDAAKSNDAEEQAQILRMHELFNQFDLDTRVRWLGTHLEKNIAGELYRYIADHRGVFVQPALFEAFGLTVVEAMSSGLPTFATRYGGPLEIIEHGVSGFHIDPNHGEGAAELITEFLVRCRDEQGYWETISGASLERIRSRYTWELYAERMMTLSRIYGFWKYVTNLERQESRRYLEMFYGLQYRGLSEKVRH